MPDADLSIPTDATDEEAAAIAAAISSYLAGRGDGGTEASWEGDRWGFAGRLSVTRGAPARVPTDAPRDAWTASGRTDRF